MSFRIATYLVNSVDLVGGKGQFGDARFGYQWAVDNAILLSEPVTPAVVGQEKYVPMEEIKTERYFEILQNKAYFNNTPPTPELDKDDPNQDMARIFNPISKSIVKKGALFLFGQQKFKGIDSFKITNVDLDIQWKNVWSANDMDCHLNDMAQSYLRDGDVFYKVISKKTGTQLIGQSESDGYTTDLVSETVDIQFLKTDAGNWSAICSISNPNLVVAWIYQFERADGVFIREEYFRDQTLYYEGQRSADTSQKQSKIFDLGLSMNQRQVEEKVHFVLKSVEVHNLHEFPIIRVKNNEQSSFWGVSLYAGHYGQFDRLNEVYTQLGYAIKMMADPLLWVAGSEVNDQNTKAADAVWSFTDPGASLNVLQWPGIPDSVFKFIDMVESKIYEDAFVPRTNDLDKLFGSENRMSGKGIQELKSDIVDATMSRRHDFEDAFKQMIEMTALLTGIKITEEDSMIDIIWGPVFQSGSVEKRDSLLSYYDKKIISRETVIDLSDDFPPEMKESLIEDLSNIDKQTIEMTQALLPPKPVAVSTTPAPKTKRAVRTRPKK